DRHVRAIENKCSSIADKLKFDPRSIGTGRGHRSHHHEIPERRAVRGSDADAHSPCGTRRKTRDSALAAVRDAPAPHARKGGWPAPTRKGVVGLGSHVDADDLICFPAVAG